MKFGATRLDEAEGAILAHSVGHRTGVFKKGRVLTRNDLDLIAETGRETIYAARLDPGDVVEDEAAARLAAALAGDNVVVQAPFTGRANIHCGSPGVAVIDADRVRRLNHVHESITLATVPPFETCDARRMLATVKIIPFAIPSQVLNEALQLIGNEPLVSFKPFKALRAGLVISILPQMKPGLIEKTQTVIEARLAALGSRLAQCRKVSHDETEIAAAIEEMNRAGLDLILLFGASAIVDRGDVIPAAVERSGGVVIHLGMPVDPGNLLMLARIGTVPVIGVPSCARSPKINGFDWVLARMCGGVSVSATDIMDMGSGGLLKEIASRPAPREGAGHGSQHAPRVSAILLAAGQSTRMAGPNKLLQRVEGETVVRRSAQAMLAAGVDELTVVTGHEASEIEGALDGLAVNFAHNPDYAQGMATSLVCGLGAVGKDTNAVLVGLADMPFVAATDVRRMIAAFSPDDGRSIIVPVFDGKRGNPVLWAAELIGEMKRIAGDTGARDLLRRHAEKVCEVATDDPGILTDLDTPEAFAAIKEA